MRGKEEVVTIAMRGDGDAPMGPDTDTKLLENIVKEQRRIIAEVTGKSASKTPQLWALYSEVLEYYDQGMQIPDDVMILLCDDNWEMFAVCPNRVLNVIPVVMACTIMWICMVLRVLISG